MRALNAFENLNNFCVYSSHRKMMNLSFLSASKWKTRKQLKLSSFLHSNLKIRKLRNPVNEAFLLCNSKLLSKFCLNYLKKSNYAEQKLTSRIHREIPGFLDPQLTAFQSNCCLLFGYDLNFLALRQLRTKFLSSNMYSSMCFFFSYLGNF